VVVSGASLAQKCPAKRITCPDIHLFLLPPLIGSPRLWPAPFDGVGGTQYERLVGGVRGKAAEEFEITYSV